MKRFAIQLPEQFTNGETVEQLAASLAIPAERVAARIRAAERHVRFHDHAVQHASVK